MFFSKYWKIIGELVRPFIILRKQDRIVHGTNAVWINPLTMRIDIAKVVVDFRAFGVVAPDCGFIGFHELIVGLTTGFGWLSILKVLLEGFFGVCQGIKEEQCTFVESTLGFVSR